MAVSGMANSVFSVATRNRPWTDRPTPCGWRRTKVRKKKYQCHDEKRRKQRPRLGKENTQRGGNRAETLITVTSTERHWAKVWDGKCWLKKKKRKPGRPCICVCDLRVWLPTGSEVKADEQRWPEDISSTVRTLCVCVCVRLKGYHGNNIPLHTSSTHKTMQMHRQVHCSARQVKWSCSSVTMKYVI